jgi:hypothetical protein
MIYTETNIKEVIQLSDDEIEFITTIATDDLKEKLDSLEMDYNIDDFNVGYEFICRVTLKPKK